MTWPQKLADALDRLGHRYLRPGRLQNLLCRRVERAYSLDEAFERGFQRGWADEEA